MSIKFFDRVKSTVEIRISKYRWEFLASLVLIRIHRVKYGAAIVDFTDNQFTPTQLNTTYKIPSVSIRVNVTLHKITFIKDYQKSVFPKIRFLNKGLCISQSRTTRIYSMKDCIDSRKFLFPSRQIMYFERNLYFKDTLRKIVFSCNNFIFFNELSK